MQGFSGCTKCSDSVQVGEKHSSVLFRTWVGEGNNRASLIVLSGYSEVMCVKSLAHVVSCLSNAELFLFILLYPKEVNHKKTTTFPGILF
jgi:hypothetical protein